MASEAAINDAAREGVAQMLAALRDAKEIPFDATPLPLLKHAHAISDTQLGRELSSFVDQLPWDAVGRWKEDPLNSSKRAMCIRCLKCRRT